MKKRNEYFTDSGNLYRRLRLSNAFIVINLVLTAVLLTLIGISMATLYQNNNQDPPREEYSRTNFESETDPAEQSRTL